MALVSRQNAVLDAIVQALNNDADLAAVYTFQKRKKAWHRGASWEPGAYVSFVPREGNQYFENEESEIVLPAAVVIVDPHDAALTGDAAINAHIGAVERIEEIFRYKSHAKIPASIRALNTSLTGLDQMTVNKTGIEYSVVYETEAFKRGQDVSAVIVRIHANVAMRDSSAL